MLIINGRILRARLSKTVNHRVQQLIFKLHSYSCCLAAEHGKALLRILTDFNGFGGFCSLAWRAYALYIFHAVYAVGTHRLFVIVKA